MRPSLRLIGFPNLADSTRLPPSRKSLRAGPERAPLAGTAQPAAPYVIAATYDEARDRINLEFDRGFAVAISPRPYPGFRDATAAELQEIEVLGAGSAVYFSRIDQSLSVANLLAEMTGPLPSATSPPLTARKRLSSTGKTPPDPPRAVGRNRTCPP